MNNITKYRGLIGMSQKKLAEELGISRTGLNLMENGRIWIIKKKTVTKMTEILKVTPTQLLGLENLKYEPESKEDIDYMISLLEKLKEEK